MTLFVDLIFLQRQNGMLGSFIYLSGSGLKACTRGYTADIVSGLPPPPVANRKTLKRERNIS